MDADDVTDPAGPTLVGARLRRARVEAGLSRQDLATATRIPERHLAALEKGDHAALPARTYVMGFTRSYARALGLDEQEILRDLRAEMGVGAGDANQGATPTFTPGDPARVPSARFARLASLAVAVLALVALVFWRVYWVPEPSLPSILPPPVASPAPTHVVVPLPAPSAVPVAPMATGTGAAPVASAVPAVVASPAPSPAATPAAKPRVAITPAPARRPHPHATPTSAPSSAAAAPTPGASAAAPAAKETGGAAKASTVSE